MEWLEKKENWNPPGDYIGPIFSLKYDYCRACDEEAPAWAIFHYGQYHVYSVGEMTESAEAVYLKYGAIWGEAEDPPDDWIEYW